MTQSSTAPSPVESTHSHVACPFCALVCDDLATSSRGGVVSLTGKGCALARQRLERPPAVGVPQVAGAAVTRAKALRAAAGLLRAARSPLIGGMATDVDGAREALALAERTRGIVDHAASQDLLRNLKTLRERGWVLTTFGEVRNRADLLVLVGTTGLDTHPRFFERLLPADETLFGPLRREVVVVGKGLRLRGEAAAGLAVEHLPAPLDALGEVAYALRALLGAQRLDARRVAGLRQDALEALAARLKAARYPVIVWSAALLPAAGAAVTIQAWAELARDLNETGRCVGLPIGAAHGVGGVNQVSTWQTGYPLPVRFTAEGPAHDPQRFAAAQALASGDADLLVWVSGLGAGLAPPNTSVPRIVLSDDPAQAAGADVFLPVGTAGVDHAGRMFRADGVVCLPVRALREALAPSVADTLSALRQAL